MPYDRTSYFKSGGNPRDAQTLAMIARETAESVEAMRGSAARDVAEIGAGSHTSAAESQAGAYRYGADQKLAGENYGADMTYKGLSVPRVSENTTYDLTPAPIPGWGEPDKRPDWNPPGLAKGGLAQAARPYIVGEKGPELMVPETNGTIIPNHRLQAILARKPIPREGGGKVFRPPPPGTQWVGRQSLANAGQAARTAAEVRLHEDDARAKYFEPTLPKLAAKAAEDKASEDAFRAQANAMFTVPGADGRPQVDPRATALINLYAKLPVTPEYALGAVQHGMEIHKLADSWKDGTKLAQLSQIANIPSAEAERLKAGDPVAVLKAENWLGNDHGYNPGVLTGQRSWKSPPMAVRPAVVPVPTPAAGVAPVPVAAPAPSSLMDAVNPFKNVAPLGTGEPPRGYETVKNLVAPVRDWVNKNAPPLGSGELPRGLQTIGNYFAEPEPTVPVNQPVGPPTGPQPTFETNRPYVGVPVPIVEPPVKPVAEVAPVYQP